MAKLPKNFNWTESVPHIELLSVFQNPSHPARINKIDGLGESMKDAFERLKNLGAITEASLEIVLACSFTAAELKQMVKPMGGKASGSKMELIAELIRLDPTGIRKQCQEMRLYKCTDLGSRVLSEFAEKKEKALEEAQARIYQALHNQDVVGASNIYSLYKKQYPAKGYDPFRTFPEKNIYDLIQHSPLWMREQYGEANIRHILAAVAMKEVWKNKTVWEWLPEGFPIQYEKVLELEPLLEKYRQYVEMIAVEVDASFFDLALVFDSNEYADPEERICENCQQLDGLILSHYLIPDWPFDGCSNPYGCLPESCHQMSGSILSRQRTDFDEEVDDEALLIKFEEAVRNYKLTVNPKSQGYLGEYREIRKNLEKGKVSGEKYITWLSDYLPEIGRYSSYVFNVIANHIPNVRFDDPENAEDIRYSSRRMSTRLFSSILQNDDDEE